MADDAEGVRLPVVPGAALVKREGSSGYYSAHFDPVEELWVMLYRVGPGKFLAIPSAPRLLNRLPDGVAWRVWRRRAAMRRGWRHWRIDGTDADGAFSGRVLRSTADVPDDDATEGEPWTVDGVTITRARMTLPSVCGQRDGRAFLRDEIEDDNDD